MGSSKSSSKREVYSNIGLTQEISKMDKPLARSLRKWERAQINKIRNEREVTINITDKIYNHKRILQIVVQQQIGQTFAGQTHVFRVLPMTKCEWPLGITGLCRNTCNLPTCVRILFPHVFAGCSHWKSAKTCLQLLTASSHPNTCTLTLRLKSHITQFLVQF